MASQSGVAFQDLSFQPSRPNPTGYYPMASSSSYSPRDQSISPQDLSSLAHQFGQQSIRHDPRTVTNTYCQPTASGPYHHQVPQPHATSSPHHTLQSHQSSVRSQRQASSRLQCSAGHVQQLSSLVDRMVAAGQCSVCNEEAARPQPSSTWEEETMGEEFEDEGFEEPPSLARLSYRRSTDLSAGGQGYVAKSIRVRKKARNDPSRLR
jgi:hypothetical protein